MSGSKTVTLPKKAKSSGADQQPQEVPTICGVKIREAAYLKWEAAGCPNGDGVEFWLAAEAELTTATESAAAVDEQS